MTTRMRSARGWLLGRAWRRQGDEAVLAGELVRVEASARGGPVLRGEGQSVGRGPLGEDADELGEVLLGVEAVEPGGGDEGHDRGGGPGVVVAACEEPVLASDGDAAEGALASVVVERQAAVLERAQEGRALAEGVAEGAPQRASKVCDLRVLDLGPGEEGIHFGREALLAFGLDGRGRLLTPGFFEFIESSDPEERLTGHLALRDGGLPELSSRVGPASDLGTTFRNNRLAVVAVLDPRLEEPVVDALGVGLKIAIETIENTRDGGARLLLCVDVDDVVVIRDDREDVSAFAGPPGAPGSRAGRMPRPVASVATQKALRASSIISETMASPSQSPIPLSQRAITLRSRSRPMRAKRSLWRKSGSPSQNLLTATWARSEGAASRRGTASGGISVRVTVSSPSSPSRSYLGRSIRILTGPALRQPSCQVTS